MGHGLGQKNHGSKREGETRRHCPVCKRMTPHIKVSGWNEFRCKVCGTWDYDEEPDKLGVI